MKKRALIDVRDKSSILDFSQKLITLGFEIVALGTSYDYLKENDIEVLSASDVTTTVSYLGGSLDGLSSKIHMGILANRSNAEDILQMKEMGVEPIDVVAVELPSDFLLYKDKDLKSVLDNINVGAAAVLRAAAKNYEDVAVLVDDADYDKVLAELSEKGEVSKETKTELCFKALSYISHYDALICSYFSKQRISDNYPDMLTLTYEKTMELTNGENVHQRAALYRDLLSDDIGIKDAKQLFGDAPSYNCICDIDYAISIIEEFDKLAVISVKGRNVSGAGESESVYEAYMRACKKEFNSPEDCVVITNSEIDRRTALEIIKYPLNAVVAPAYSEDSLEVLESKEGLRVFELPQIRDRHIPVTDEFQSISGGVLVQSVNNKLLEENDLLCLTDNNPTEEQLKELIFAWKISKHTKSNSAVIAKDGQIIGVGQAQNSSIAAAGVAISKCSDICDKAVIAFDNVIKDIKVVESLQQAGISAIIYPGGALIEQELIDKCNENEIVLMTANITHYKN